MQALSLIGFGVINQSIDPSFNAKQDSNTTGLHHASVFALVVAGIGAVLIAPLVEEPQFRGRLLQAGLVRWRFPVAAVASSLVLGALHSYEASRAPYAGPKNTSAARSAVMSWKK
jgi:membrane protease YdiL (CAAX protease family)